MDVKTTFLNEDLKDEVYMDQLKVLYFLKMRKNM